MVNPEPVTAPVAADVDERTPPDKERPVPTVISSIAPVAAVVLPNTLAAVMVNPEPVTAPVATTPRLVLASAAVVAPVPP